jgi:chorismate dehydratase
LKLRVSFSGYLNSAPLGWSFLHGPLKDQFEVVESSPARCADLLAQGRADIALIPSVEYLRIPDLAIVPDIAVAACGPVRSVLLVAHREREIRTVAVDTCSRTSIVLLNLWLRSVLNAVPEFVPHEPDLVRMLDRCDAALLIGDSALSLPAGRYEIQDMAEAWVRWQEKPFVFALWACRAGNAEGDGLAPLIQEAKAWGLGMRRQIAEIYSRRLNLPAADLEDYLFRNVDYDLSDRHLEGLSRFYRLAEEGGLVPVAPQLRFLGGRNPGHSSSTFQ